MVSYPAVDFLGLRGSGFWSQFIDPPQDFPQHGQITKILLSDRCAGKTGSNGGGSGVGLEPI